MCGICGVLYLNGKSVDLDVLDSMCRVIEHRGPDDQGTFVQDQVGIGMRRLSIIDLHMGHQPISNERNNIQVVFNGEIYNFETLRDDLITLGHVFKTHSDTEVIVHAYEQWGRDCVTRFVGMFSFALWDETAQSLFLARDPLGIKPLYYYCDRNMFLFGSEIKCLLQVPEFSPQISKDAVNTYFSYGLIHAPNSIYRDVYKLLPGESIVVTASKSIEKRRYWQPQYRTSEKRHQEDLELELWEKLKESVALHMISDVPLGAFLSGGVDSSAIVAAMCAVSDTKINTFSIRFDVQKYDEAPYARAVAKHLQTDHHELTVAMDDVSDILPKLAWHYDEPFADSSAVPSYYVSKMTRQHVKVALSGDGGDELFAGYPQFQNERLVQCFETLPSLFKKNVARFLMSCLPEQSPFVSYNYFLARLKRLYQDALLPTSMHRFFNKTRLAKEDALSRVLSADFQQHVNIGVDINTLVNHFLEVHGKQTDPIEALLYVNTVVGLPDDMLTKVDRASMANSLEVRVPFLAHPFVEFAASLPLDMKLNGLKTKFLLKKVLAKHIPHTLVYRKKQGFSIPLDVWFRGGLADYVRGIIGDSRPGLDDILNFSGIEAVIREHQSGYLNHSELLYSIVVFICWYDHFQ